MTDSDFEVGSGDQLREKFRLDADHRPKILLDPARIPGVLRHLIPLAEQFGVSDDLIRDDVLAKSDPKIVEAMKQAVSSLDPAFDEWLAGPEAKGPNFSDEYIAFTCLRIAADDA